MMTESYQSDRKLMTFYKLTPETAEILMNAKLTAAEWRLWTFLATTVDAWGDRYIDLPDTLTIMEKCNIKKSTYYRAIARLQELGLYDFQDKGFAARNLRGNSKISSSPKSETVFQNPGELSEISEKLPKKRKPISNLGKLCEISENQTLEPLSGKDSRFTQTLKDSYRLFTDSLSEAERESFLNFSRERTAQLPRAIASIGDYLAAPDSSGEPRFKEFYAAFLASSASTPAREVRLEAQLTPELYAEWDKIFRQEFGEHFIKFHDAGPGGEGARELRQKFCQRWSDINQPPPFAHIQISEEEMRQRNREARERAKAQLQERLAGGKKS